jgi:hypothetical protein
MIHKAASALLIWIASATITFGAEFSKETIHRYSSYVALDLEAKEYIHSLPPESITDLVNELDFTRNKKWRNTTMFSLVLIKVSQLEESNVDYDKKWVFGKLAEFIRILALDGYSGDAGTILSQVGNSRKFHPEMVEVAKELAAGDDQRNSDRAKEFLVKHEKWKRDELRQRKRESAAQGPSTSPVSQKIVSDEASPMREGNNADWKPWTLLLSAILLLSAAFRVFWMKRRAA